MRKWIGLLLTMALLLAMALPAAAEEVSGTSGNISWALDTESGELRLDGSGAMLSYYQPTAVPWYAYREKITSVILPEGITNLGNYAFYDCKNLKSVTIPASVQQIGSMTFFGCRSISAFAVSRDSAYFCADDSGVLYTKDQSVLLQAPRSLSGSYRIPEETVKIADYAFYLCANLTAVELPKGLKTIGAAAFSGCSGLQTVAVPASVSAVGSGAFSDCSALTSISVEKENANYSSDESGVLLNKEQTVLIQAPGGISGSYSLPETVTKIGESAFVWCMELEEVIFGAKLAEIGKNAFTGCEYLSLMRFYGNAPTIHSSAFTDVYATAEYPENNATWTASVQKDYGGSIEWAAYTPEPAPLFELSGSNVILGNDLTMNFALLASHLDGTDYYAEIVKYNPDGTTTTTTYPFSSWTAYGPMYLITLDGLVAKQMSDKVEVTVYTGDGVQASYTWVDSIRDYSIRQLNTTSNTAKVFTVLADMLNYGAAAQVQFNYNTSDLANATMTDTHKSYATAALDFSLYTNNQVVGDNFFGTILALETNIKMGVFFKGTGYEGYTAKVSYRDHNGNTVSYEVAGKDFDATYAANGMYGIMVDTLVAGDVYQVVTVEVYDGETLVASVSESMESYVVRQSASLLPIYDALMKFMVSSYNYSH